MSIQTIRKTPFTLVGMERPEDPKNRALLDYLHILVQQTNALGNAVQQFPGAVGGGVTTVTLTLPIPQFDVNYVAVATPSWDTTVFIDVPATDITKTSVKFTFGTASPGGGGTLFVWVVR